MTQPVIKPWSPRPLGNTNHLDKGKTIIKLSFFKEKRKRKKSASFSKIRSIGIIIDKMNILIYIKNINLPKISNKQENSKP